MLQGCDGVIKCLCRLQIKFDMVRSAAAEVQTTEHQQQRTVQSQWQYTHLGLCEEHTGPPAYPRLLCWPVIEQGGCLLRQSSQIPVSGLWISF